MKRIRVLQVVKTEKKKILQTAKRKGIIEVYKKIVIITLMILKKIIKMKKIEIILIDVSRVRIENIKMLQMSLISNNLKKMIQEIFIVIMNLKIKLERYIVQILNPSRKKLLNLVELNYKIIKIIT